MADVDELYSYLVHDAEGVEEGAEKEEKQLGAGSYGYIYKVRVGGVERIAKRLHRTFIDRSRVSTEEVDSIEAKFRNECIILSKLRHPNIVQFIGVHYGLRGHTDITLIMECVSTDLDNFLGVHPNIPLPVKLSILRDVSFGLVYLHEYKPPIIHRDLTARNVLVTDRYHAKIADLGVAKLVDIQAQFATSHTHTPGQMFYMPPEALTEKASCTPKLDIFSFGHLTLYVVVQEFPKVFTVTVTPDLQRQGTIERFRRGRYIERVGEDHCLYSIIIECLLDSPDRRPDTRYLNERMVFLSTLNPLTLKDISQLVDKDPYRECDHTKLEEEIVRLREESEEHTKRVLNQGDVIHELTDTKTTLELEIEQLRLKNVAVIDEMAVARAEADLYKADFLEERKDREKTQGALNDLQKKMNKLSSKLKDDRNKHGNGYGTEQEHKRSSSSSSSSPLSSLSHRGDVRRMREEHREEVALLQARYESAKMDIERVTVPMKRELEQLRAQKMNETQMADVFRRVEMERKDLEKRVEELDGRCVELLNSYTEARDLLVKHNIPIPNKQNSYPVKKDMLNPELTELQDSGVSTAVDHYHHGVEGPRHPAWCPSGSSGGNPPPPLPPPPLPPPPLPPRFHSSGSDEQLVAMLLRRPPKTQNEKQCCMCLNYFKDYVETTNCGDVFCPSCMIPLILNSLHCPVCRQDLTPLRGNQPKGGTINIYIVGHNLPGYPDCATVMIDYEIPNVIQETTHPHPGRELKGICIRAYLPGISEGYDVATLLKRAFEAGLTFTVAVFDDGEDAIVWNGISHKTGVCGKYGYPDTGYLGRVTRELAAKGIN